MLEQSDPHDQYENGMQVGKSHSLVVHESENFNVKREGQIIHVSLPSNMSLNSPSVRTEIRDVVQQALRKEAKSYLSKRLAYLATKHNFDYEKVRFSHASSRWGSCSSNGTISLNIALMNSTLV